MWYVNSVCRQHFTNNLADEVTLVTDACIPIIYNKVSRKFPGVSPRDGGKQDCLKIWEKPVKKVLVLEDVLFINSKEIRQK